MFRPWEATIEWLGEHGGIVLLAVLLVVLGVWGFAELLDEVREGQTQRFDEWAITRVTQWHGPEYRMLEEIGRDITALGGIVVLVLVTCAVAVFLWMSRNYAAMWLVVIATAGGLTLASVLKYFIDRPRPQIGTHLSHVYTTSFPSGHSMMSAVVYLTLGSLLTQVVHRRRLKLYVLALALFVTFLVGLSRVYMGVHWPTDVLAGWTAGLVWAILCWLVARQLRRRGKLDEVDDELETKP